MAQKKAAGPGLDDAKSLLHIGTQVTVTFGILEGEDVRPLPPLSLTLNRLSEPAFTELRETIEAQRALKLAELNNLSEA